MDDLALLRLQAEWGADEAIDFDPADRLRAIVRPAQVVVPAGGRPAAASRTDGRPPEAASLGGTLSGAAGPAIFTRPLQAPRVAAGTPAERAAAAAAEAGSIDALRDAIAAFDGCGLRETASNLVFVDGDPAAGLLLIGDPPGADEDRAGKPFAGKDGALLDRMLGSIGLTRGQALLAPVIPWRPPGGRPPNTSEMAACLPFLHRLVALSGPKRIVIFGTLAARALLPANAGRRRAAIGWTACAIPGMTQPVPALALPGLASLSKTPLSRKDAWAGLRLLRRALDADASNEQPADASNEQPADASNEQHADASNEQHADVSDRPPAETSGE